MSCCGTTVPLNEIVAAVAAQLANQQPKTEYVAKEDGVLKNLTLKGDVSLDSAAKASLCEALEDCIKDLIAETGSIKSFEVLGEQLRITMPDGTIFPVDLSQFVTATEAVKITDEIKKVINDDYLKTATLNGETLIMTMNSGKQLRVPLTGLSKDVNLSSGTVQGNNLVLTKSDGAKVTINLEQFANVAPTAGNVALANDERTVLGKFLA